MALIEREAALEICEKEYQERLRMLDYCGDTVAWNIGGAIKVLPTIDATPTVHGRWVKRADKGCWWCACSVCGAHIAYDGWGGDYFSPYCPNCGARMDGGQEHEAIEREAAR